MREILFRGKRLDNCEWVEGSLLKVTLNGEIFYLIFGDNFSFFGDDVKALSHAIVDPSTVGQYTGLSDKNGKRIFEEDILEFEAYGTHFKGHVEIVNGNASIMCKNASPFLDLAVEKHGAKVIGNIHDNPELLGGKFYDNQ